MPVTRVSSQVIEEQWPRVSRPSRLSFAVCRDLGAFLPSPSSLRLSVFLAVELKMDAKINLSPAQHESNDDYMKVACG